LVYRVSWPAASPVCPLGKVRPGRRSVFVNAGSVSVDTGPYSFLLGLSTQRAQSDAVESRKGFRRRSLCGSASNSSLRILRIAPRALREKRTIPRHRRGHAKAISTPRKPACRIDPSRTNGTKPTLHQVAAALAHTGPTPKPPFQTQTITAPTQNQIPLAFPQHFTVKEHIVIN
jgi:hypothetical protein